MTQSKRDCGTIQLAFSSRGLIRSLKDPTTSQLGISNLGILNSGILKSNFFSIHATALSQAFFNLSPILNFSNFSPIQSIKLVIKLPPIAPTYDPMLFIVAKMVTTTFLIFSQFIKSSFIHPSSPSQLSKSVQFPFVPISGIDTRLPSIAANPFVSFANPSIALVTFSTENRLLIPPHKPPSFTSPSFAFGSFLPNTKSLSIVVAFEPKSLKGPSINSLTFFGKLSNISTIGSTIDLLKSHLSHQSVIFFQASFGLVTANLKKSNVAFRPFAAFSVLTRPKDRNSSIPPIPPANFSMMVVSPSFFPNISSALVQP